MLGVADTLTLSCFLIMCIGVFREFGGFLTYTFVGWEFPLLSLSFVPPPNIAFFLFLPLPFSSRLSLAYCTL